jgi:hypothetical protein
VPAQFVAPGQLIHARPAIVETRTRIGDCEGDLIVGRCSRSVIATLVDRTSRFAQLVHLPHGHSVGGPCRVERGGSVTALVGTPDLDLGPGLRDGPARPACRPFRDGVYFPLPASPWQRGTNENSNGLLRQYLPKGSDLSIHSAQTCKPSWTDSTTGLERCWDGGRLGGLRRRRGIMTVVTVATTAGFTPFDEEWASCRSVVCNYIVLHD